MEHQMQAEHLAHGTSVCVSDTHKFGADALFLAQFAAPHPMQRVCDLGTGCGILPLHWHDRGHRGTCVAVDISPEAIALLACSVAENHAQHIVPVCADLRVWRPQRAEFDVVTCNPPYFVGGLHSKIPARAVARHEESCTTQEVCAAAGRLLRNGGRFFVCQRPARLTDVLCAMRAAGIEPKRLRFVTARLETEAWLFLVEGQKGRAAGLRVLPPLVTEKADGTSPTPEDLALYNNLSPKPWHKQLPQNHPPQIRRRTLCQPELCIL